MSQDAPSTPLHSVSVAGAVIDDEGRFLCIKRRDNGKWELPGGVLELDETPEHGVEREVMEETGLTVEPLALTGVYKNMRRGIVALVFRCRVTGGLAVATSESRSVAWLTSDEVRARLSPAYSIRLLDAVEGDRSVRVRVHDGTNLISSIAAEPL